MEQRLRKQTPENRTLIVVCASGGGIQAAGWTARVLTGLQEKFNNEDFTRKIGMISAVSGGSVGTLYFLDRFRDGQADPGQFNTIFNAATEDSLDATGWGLSYPDLWRFIGAPFLRTTPRDRGAAIELNWKSVMQNPGETLQGWHAKVLTGELPIPVLNSTFVENGRAYQLTPVSLNPSKGLVSFTQLFPQYDLDTSTAALLSATFPYVTPISRNSNPQCLADLPVYHVADGGFFDNFGVVSAVDWLDREVLPKGLGIKRVLIVEILAFPDPKPVRATEASNKPAGWFMAVFGPLFTLANARNATQAQRNDEAIEELIQDWNSPDLTVTRHKISFPDKISFFDFSLLNALQNPQSRLAAMADKLKIESYADKLKTALEDKSYQPPLSWKLTRQQKEAIERAWKQVENGADVAAIGRALK